MVTQDDVMQVLAGVVEPDLGTDLVTADLVRGVVVGPGKVAVHVALTTPATPHRQALREQIEAGLRALPGVTEVELRLQADPPSGNAKLPNVRHVLGVGAGKGGVGKSTVAVNLAVALAQAGAKVGLLDADVYGPSVPIMLGLRGTKPSVNAQRKIIPAEAHGIKAISMGFMVQEDMAVAWRGPMVGRAVTQFVEDVDWGELDYLIVDLPPGTGDIILSLCQAIPLSGAVVVSTPQDVAFADVVRAVRMFSMLKVDLVGLVENMSYFRCPDNGKDYEIFGPSNSKGNCEAHAIPFLGKLALDMLVSPNADAGRPIVAAEPTSHQAETYRLIAGQVASKLVQKAWQDRATSTLGEGFFGARPPA
jgi:ATP-binding protein involved in chromosome partitioning